LESEDNMGVRESLQKLVDRKASDIVRLEQELRDAKVYMQAIQDSLRLLPKELNGAPVVRELRPGTAVAQAQDFLKAVGEPQHIDEILVALHKPNTKENRVSLIGSLAGYVRDGRIFTKTAPNTFGLLEFERLGAEMAEREEILPDEFGR
jgi:hypothetical protein